MNKNIKRGRVLLQNLNKPLTSQLTKVCSAKIVCGGVPLPNTRKFFYEGQSACILCKAQQSKDRWDEKKKSQSLFWLILLFILTGCAAQLRTGYYTVTDVRSYTVNLKKMNGKEVPGDWHVPTDTLKVGDTIFIRRVFREKDANVW